MLVLVVQTRVLPAFYLQVKQQSQSNKVDAQLLLEWLAEHLQKGYPVKKAHELTNARMLSSSQTVAACLPAR